MSEVTSSAAVTLTADATPDDVLAFWFGTPNIQDWNTRAYLQAGWAKWFFGKDVLFDITQRSSTSLIARAASAALDHDAGWCTARGLLARIILLDQFSRCAFRGTADAMAHDVLACRLARQLAEDASAFGSLLPVERFFVCLALSHSEDVADNRLHVELAARLADGASQAEAKGFFHSLHGFPHEHFETIQRFGRFPHRNTLLGRMSTDAEAAWLASPSCPGWARSQRRALLTYWDGRGLGDPVGFLLEFGCF